MTPTLRLFACLIMLTTLSACSTSGQLSMIAKSGVDAITLLTSGRAYQTLGPAEGKACHYLLLFVPLGDSDISKAVDDALAPSGGDALLHVTTEKKYVTLPSFVYLLPIFERTCTSVKGTAVRFQ
ncbi:MAG: hypothetical protein E8D45_09445 [Nitrospira sp.]|nr:MAG: hypothetical protein E8D45_09445 [Nitrospira sp.]